MSYTGDRVNVETRFEVKETTRIQSISRSSGGVSKSYKGFIVPVNWDDVRPCGGDKGFVRPRGSGGA